MEADVFDLKPARWPLMVAIAAVIQSGAAMAQTAS
jgi:hypothetical protein